MALRQDVLGHPAPHLHRWTGHAGEGFAIAGVAVAAEVPDDADLAVALDRKIGFDDNAAAPVHLAAGAFGQQLSEGGGGDTGGPTDRAGLQADFAIGRRDDDLPVADVFDTAPQQELDSFGFEVVSSGL